MKIIVEYVQMIQTLYLIKNDFYNLVNVRLKIIKKLYFENIII